ncbi:MAG: PQQ-binding-like beta-propeller repeat protein [Planctomycetes bacterium]|nr:PQQ-binding-like beta-propeller repeat protein [Planctomycetota bacterium]
MTTFTCNECGNKQTGFPGMPPASCNRCKKRGKIWTEDSAAKPTTGVATGGNVPVPTAPKVLQTPVSSVPPPVKPPVIGGMPVPTNPGTTLPNPKAPTTNAPKVPTSPAITPPKVPATPISNPPKVPTQAPIPKPTSPVATSQPAALPIPQQPPVVQATPVVEPKPVVQAPKAVSVPKLAPASKKPRSERLIWELELPPNEQKLPQRTCPAVDHDGRMYFSCGRSLRAYDLQNSKLNSAWEFPTGGRIMSSPVVGPDGVIRVHSDDGKLYSVKKDGNSATAPAETGRPLGWSTPKVDSRLNVWVSHYHGGLWRIAPGSDVATPFLKSMHKLDCSGAIFGDTLYVGSENACVVALDLTSERGVNRWGSADNLGRANWFINSAIAIGQGPVIIATSCRNEVIAFRQDGNPIWNTQLEGLIIGSPVVGGEGEIYLGICVEDGRSSNHGEFLRIDGASGKIRWKFRTSSPLESTAVIGDDGLIYFGDNGGAIYAIDREGRQKWQDEIGVGVRSPGTILAGGLLVFGTDNGSFVGLKTESRGLAPGGWPKFLGNPQNS